MVWRGVVCRATWHVEVYEVVWHREWRDAVCAGVLWMRAKGGQGFGVGQG